MNDITKELIQLSLREDLGPRLGKNTGDITSIACLDSNVMGNAIILFKESGIVCGHELVSQIFEEIDPSIKYEILKKDGQFVDGGSIVSKLSGSVRNILTAERTLLNFMQRLSAVATLTNQVVKKINNPNVRILDTRKTTPGFREIEKYAVKVGGGTNHRMGLYDEFMIKNNHIDALNGDIAKAVSLCRQLRPNVPLKVEVRNREEITACIACNVQALLLDNFEPTNLKDEVDWIRNNGGKDIALEASGGVTPDNVESYASTGVNEISLGFLTHSVKALDISLRFVS